jgi:transcriptional regulator with XRE-family HTH domain
VVDSERIKNRMAELGMTQADLAAELSIAVPTMSQKINNYRPFSLEEAEKVSKILKIPDAEFGRYFFTK